ncbi:unnamed protein product [Phytomonas sp. EM1]|nr:unnamed protein product [Phytomonas sp. EM1]|eukprot:CCW62370.1 unnamed protein product [Phytomonas sp. isolate EM1]
MDSCITEPNANVDHSSIVLLNGSVVFSHCPSNTVAETQWDVSGSTWAYGAANNTCFMLLYTMFSWLRQWWSRIFLYCSRRMGLTPLGEQGQALLGEDMSQADPSDESDGSRISSQMAGLFVEKRRDNQPKRIQAVKVFSSQRGYAPPRSGSKKNISRRTDTPSLSQGHAASAEDGSESRRVHSDEESSTSSHLHSGVVSKERWIMQHGVLVSVGPDGPLNEVTDSMVQRLIGAGGAYVQQDRGEQRIASQGVYVDVSETNSAARAPPQIDVATVLDKLEAHRHPIYTLEQLVDFLTRCADFLPLRIEVEREGTSPPQDPVRSMERGMTPTLEYGLHFLGPLQPNPYTAVLSVLEDVIMDDCDSNALRLVSIHCSDLCFSSHLSVFEENSEGKGSLGVTGGRTLSQVDWPAKSDLDDMMSPQYPPQQHQQPACPLNVVDGEGGGYQLAKSSQLWLSGFPSTPPVLQDSLELLKESHMRLLGILKNVMDNMTNTIHSVLFTRCMFAPIDIGQSLPLTLSPLVQLIFEQCPLSPAHIDALLQLARSETRRQTSPVFSGVHPPPAFSRLAELQLSGTLTEECISELLSFFWDEVVDEKGTVLRVLRLPSLLLRSAKSHPFIQAHPYVQVLPLP